MPKLFDAMFGLAMALFFLVMFCATLVFGPAMFPLASCLVLLCSSCAGFAIGAYMLGNA
jgi:glucan phosphoethanolaminetransferase (alkaline phosphatase superfamily)